MAVNLFSLIKQGYVRRIAAVNEAAFTALTLKDDHEHVAFLQYRVCSVFAQAFRIVSTELRLDPQALVTSEVLLLVENRCLRGLADSGMKGDVLCPFVQAVSSTTAALVDIVGVLELRELHEIFDELSKDYCTIGCH
jgi:hypothetical protein